MVDNMVRFVCTVDSFKPVAIDPNIRWLEWNEEDYLLMKELFAAFGNDFTTADWKESENFGYRFAAYIKDGRIESLAAAIRWSEKSQAWEVGAVQTREEARRKGYAKWVVSFITKFILDNGKYATCNTAVANIAMKKTAQSVGFFRQDD